MKTFSENAVNFYSNLNSPKNLPDGVEVMNPFESNETISLVRKFFKKFYSDKGKRTFIIGINFGRFGGGVTGVGFTDPINLQEKCGIKNNLDKKPELSSKFVYSLIESFGSVEEFYSKFFISALYPLALIKDGKNYNYYDSKKVYAALKSQIVKMLKQQIDFGANDKLVISFGKKNAEYLKEINDELRFFKEILIFDHPRFVMQYRLKKLDSYLEKYTKVLREVSYS